MTNLFRENPYLFVVGCPRSGTTLLRRMLDAHPEIAITPETHWITRSLERGIGVTPNGLATPALISHLVASPKFHRTGIERADLESLLRRSRPVPYTDFVRGFFDLYGRLQGKALVGDKTPGYVRRLPLLHALFPETRFVHLIRDGRDVVLSALAWRRASKLASRLSTWKAHPVATAALWWERHVRSGREAGAALGAAVYYELRCEALIADPAREAESLCAFLKLRFDEAMLRFHESRRRREPGLSAKKAWLPPTPGLRDWRAEMSREDVERFEAMSGDLLDELGYPRAVPDPSPEAHQLAAKIRSALDEDFRSRKKALAEARRQ
jgi:hypothetical protein